MSISEQRAWLSLAAYGAIFAFFLMRMLADDWSIAGVSPSHMLWTYGYVAVMALIAEGIIAGSTAAREKAGGGAIEADERDHAIEARAERHAGIAVFAGVNVLVIHALMNAVYPGRRLADIPLDSLPVLVFALIAVLFIGHGTKLVSTIVSYRV